MRKVILGFALMIGAVFAMNAQTVESSKFFDNTSITIRGGVSGLVHPGCNGYENFGHTMQASTSLELGKWITPKFGVGIESTIGWENGSALGAFQGRNWLNYVDVLANAKFNLNNILHGYKGQPDKVEFVPTVGIGWVHGFTYEPYMVYGTTHHSNDIMTKYAVNVNVNLSRRIQLNFSPYAAFNLTGGVYQGKNQPRFDSRNMWYGLEAGFSVKIGKEFTNCPYKYTQADVDVLNAQINDLRQRGPEVIEKEKVVYVDKEVNNVNKVVIVFAKNEYTLTEEHKAQLAAIKKGSVVELVAGASPEGNAEYNQDLSNKRAESTRAYLEDNGIKVGKWQSRGAGLGSRIAIVEIMK